MGFELIEKKAFLKQLPEWLQSDFVVESEEKERLVEGAKCLAELKAQHKAQQNEQKALSRSIGEAKKKAQPIESLMSRMQALSARGKSLKDDIKSLEVDLYQAYCATSSLAESSRDQDIQSEFVPNELSLDHVEISLYQNTDEAWNHYVGQHCAASIYHRYETMTMIKSIFDHEVYGFVAELDGNIVGVLPVVRQNSWLFGDFMTSVPFFNYGGALAETPAIAELLMKKAGEQAVKNGCHHIEFRDAVRYPERPVRDKKVCMVLNLPSSIDALDKQLGTKIRAQIKRPMQINPKVVVGRHEILDEFYQVFARNMRDLGTPVYSKQFFRTVLDTYGDQCTIVLIRLDGKPVSAGFLLGYKDRLEIPWASTIKEANKYSINMLLYWKILCFAIKQGYKQFDFGRSTKGEGTYRFKEQWGARPVPCYWHYWLPEGKALPELNPRNSKFKLMIAIWQRLPVFLTRLIGPPIVKFLP